MFYLILPLLFLEKLSPWPLQRLLVPAKDGFKCSNFVSLGPSEHDAIPREELESRGRGEGEGTWRRNW